MTLDDARRETLAVLASESPEDVAYIDEDLIALYEAEGVDVTAKPDDQALTVDAAEAIPEAGVYYGNHLLARSGLLYFSNGRTGYPNDPCGQRNRWYVRMTPGSYYQRFRNCGAFWGFKIVVY